MSLGTLSRSAYQAVALAFAGRFQQLHHAARADDAKAVLLAAATFAVDRTVPDPELTLRARFRTTEDPVRFLIEQRDIVFPVPTTEWRARPPLLRKSSLSPMLDAMDTLLKGGSLPEQRASHVHAWLAPFLAVAPELAPDLDALLNVPARRRA
ncbi:MULTISPECIES: hypothetical protein [unclassified Variovorax]|uniref:hypothetical protein n=1 Tax=unclassified Variovorax TaxID=663243 RepID=UPI001317B7D5|nr:MULTISPECIES: hypothetical protein [unclassified Variovorax]VTU41898.1 hypothetical protein H6P1_00068 [Variovorax sp. PBL-H6]VTU44447.1 hypothetical protein SRS16P1_00834 [Variovorax sp. SRS16]VTU44492.1 hypothetical protein E5P1_00827 [Variovorax sp. PBL-E5]